MQNIVKQLQLQDSSYDVTGPQWVNFMKTIMSSKPITTA